MPETPTATTTVAAASDGRGDNPARVTDHQINDFRTVAFLDGYRLGYRRGLPGSDSLDQDYLGSRTLSAVRRNSEYLNVVGALVRPFPPTRSCRGP